MAERGRGFPRISLSSAVQIIDSASKFGKEWNKETFATYGAKNNAGSVRSGAFVSRLSALKEYGLITADKANVAITALGITIAKPISESERAEAIRKSFLMVGTFSDLFNSLEGGVKLPKERVIEYAVHNLGISRDSKDKFMSCFIDSGKYVGLVAYDKDAGTVLLNKTTDEPSVSDVESSADNQLVVTDTRPSSIYSTVGRNTDTGVASVPLNEQGVNHSGRGWSLSVMIKSSHQLPVQLRSEIRDLLEKADIVADKFYDLDGGE